MRLRFEQCQSSEHRHVTYPATLWGVFARVPVTSILPPATQAPIQVSQYQHSLLIAISNRLSPHSAESFFYDIHGTNHGRTDLGLFAFHITPQKMKAPAPVSSLDETDITGHLPRVRDIHMGPLVYTKVKGWHH